MIFNYMVGPAGSGKTTLTKALYEHVSHKYDEISTIILNLDPGVNNLPYNPHIDIRDFITLEEVMEAEGLGPNGGLIAATDKILDFMEDLKFEISEFNDPDFVIIDTPGQMELFAFRATGPMVASSLGYGDVKKITSFLFDPKICRKPNGYVSTLLLAASVQYRFLNIPQVNILSKIDSVETTVRDRIVSWSEDPYNLVEATDKVEKGIIREMTNSLTRLFEELGSIPSLIPVSSINGIGVDDYWGAISRYLNFDESPFY